MEKPKNPKAARHRLNRMPKVQIIENIEGCFAEARKTAASGRHVVIVTPGRMVMLKKCSPPGSVSKELEAKMEAIIPSQVKQNVAVISYTDVFALGKDDHKAIPFMGFLIGFAYIGHAVWVFEGHPSALAAGCRDADVLFVDGGMVPYLQPDWLEIVSKVMRQPQVFIHDRETYSLRKVL